MTAARLASVLAAHTVDPAVLDARHGAVNQLLRRMLGTVPYAGCYMEIWPTGYRTENVLVPNMLNVPFSVFGLAAPMPLVGLAMYSASKAAECMYCTAHCCTFALRRGLSPEAIARTIGLPDPEKMTPAERAVVSVATSMGRSPARVEPAQVSALRQALGDKNAEWIAMAATMMGFLNKVMDLLGLELEQSVVDDVGETLAATGWHADRHPPAADFSAVIPARADSFLSLLGWLRYMPAALRFDRRASAGMPEGWPAAGEALKAAVGHDFPLLATVGPGRVRRAIAVALRDNLAPSSLGPAIKHRVAVLAGGLWGDDALIAAGEAMAGGPQPGARALVEPVDLDDGGEAAEAMLAERYGFDEKTIAALLIAVGGAESPARLPPALVERQAARLEPAELIELVTWLGVLQLLHRWGAWSEAVAALHG